MWLVSCGRQIGMIISLRGKMTDDGSWLQQGLLALTEYEIGELSRELT